MNDQNRFVLWGFSILALVIGILSLMGVGLLRDDVDDLMAADFIPIQVEASTSRIDDCLVDIDHIQEGAVDSNVLSVRGGCRVVSCDVSFGEEAAGACHFEMEPAEVAPSEAATEPNVSVAGNDNTVILADGNASVDIGSGDPLYPPTTQPEEHEDVYQGELAGYADDVWLYYNQPQAFHHINGNPVFACEDSAYYWYLLMPGQEIKFTVVPPRSARHVHLNVDGVDMGHGLASNHQLVNFGRIGSSPIHVEVSVQSGPRHELEVASCMLVFEPLSFEDLAGTTPVIFD